MNATVTAIGRSSWVWAMTVPALPEVDPEDSTTLEAYRTGYQALAETVGASSVGSCAVQLRLISRGTSAEPTAAELTANGAVGDVKPMPSPPRHRGVQAVLLGRASTAEAAADLFDLALACLPTTLHLQPIDDPAELRRLCEVDESRLSLIEVVRRVEDGSPDIGSARGAAPALPVVVRWDTEPAGLLEAATMLSQQPNAASIVLHMQPAEASQALLDDLEATIRDIAADHDVASSPLRTQVILESRRRLRDLPRAAIRLRVLLVSEEPIAAPLAVAVGLALTSAAGFEARTIRSATERLAMLSVVETLTDNAVARSPIEELLYLADTYEAARVVRFPSPAPGGSVGLHSAPLPALPRSAEHDRPPGTATVTVGPALGGGTVALSLRELNQHLVVCGLPGFGKTMTTQSIVLRLYEEHRIPFLVIDPAKSDYRRLLAANDAVHYYDLGPDQLAFNPFGVPAGCPVAAHAGRVLAAFDAAFQLSSTFPAAYVTLARAIYRSYDLDGTPTLDTLTQRVQEVIRQTGYVGETLGNIRGALLGRLEFLARGPLGISLTGGADAVLDYDRLMSSPAVVGLRRFAGPTERALVFGLLLAGLISYREHNPLEGQLGHLTVLEEAHRLLAAAQGSAPETEGVRMFVEALAELRGSGEGFVVVDQAPTLLHAGVLKLAGSVCAHRLVDPAERMTIGASLLLDESQSLDLARLHERQVVVHSADRTASVVATVTAWPALVAASGRAVPTGPARPTSIRLPWTTAPAPPGWTDAEIRSIVQEMIAANRPPLELITDLAARFHDAGVPVVAFRAHLDLVAELITAEITTRNQHGPPDQN